jgi:hypothetical protein
MPANLEDSKQYEPNLNLKFSLDVLQDFSATRIFRVCRLRIGISV